ncbi:hypothetical protein BU649_11975 [Staphylococcus chromogenes]|uniref:Uncharacterized protein n=6 Tax=Staphylococcus chromogenes TaxID=46126 RepID=A0AAX0ZI92_STACR|nr:MULTISPECIES: DUF6007 family protein [Staphylococcus]KDP13147.1 hypothetical protein SCHR_05807 [Staphylococcus chromogenes MU 970]MBP0046973.1 hypothetical protein [Staphylococcus chromogenes]MBV5138689.1 hypothetical protein [Staphylococcus chromogenes]MBW6089827.1 hypothetical protein [Staphylococcus chromogenes]MCD9060607.1 DUF6007 family protein [Staphylococcus chromogenes]
MKRNTSELDQALKCMGWMDLLWFIPSAFLFSYLPDDYLWQIFLNLFIVIFTAIGICVSVQYIYNRFKKRQ